MPCSCSCCSSPSPPRPPLDPEDCWPEVSQADYYECLARAYGASWVDNFGDCFGSSQLVPCDGEEDHWAATWLDLAPGTHVQNVRYHLYQGPAEPYVCDASLAHTAALYVAHQSEPDADPVVIEQWTARATGPQATGQVVREHTLTLPYVVGPGEHLFVAVQYAGDVDPDPFGGCGQDGPVLCQSTCPNDDTSNLGYWSFAAAPPFSWVSLSDLGLSQIPRVGARTYTVP